MTNPRPSLDQLGAYYISDDYISHAKKARSIVDLIYKVSRVFTLNWKLSLIKMYSAPKPQLTLLDYGCGTGDFLKEAKASGHKTEGVEPSEKARALAIQNTESDIKSTIEEVNAKFDTITLWHVLEHIPDLNKILTTLAGALEENGTMFIAVPNHESYDAQRFQNQWAGYDVPRHLWHFAKPSMEKLLSKNGLRLITIIPMKLDSFYVSILSAKYQQGESTLWGFIKGLYIGLLSNMKAKKTNHSSLIYIARKK
jgi:2-polyprenyl-3-methyl-5-hydroxy-6-metoxy-1,4-benzoquinol methylase